MTCQHCRRRVLLGLVVLPLALAGCGGGGASADAPPAIRYGRDVCARCGMIVSDERHAGGLVGTDGAATVFDDVGELIAFVQEQGLGERRVWVHDFDSKAWIDGATASYVVSEDAQTPMATGVVAFDQRAAAEGFAAANRGRVLPWTEILAGWRIDDQAS